MGSGEPSVRINNVYIMGLDGQSIRQISRVSFIPKSSRSCREMSMPQPALVIAEMTVNLKEHYGQGYGLSQE